MGQRRRRTAGIVLCVVEVAVLGVLLVGRGSGSPPGRSQASCQHGHGRACVLFVGNSYTFVNDLPAAFEALADSGGHSVATGTLAEGGATLAGHLAAAETRKTLRDSRWDVVVLQEQSQIPSIDQLRVTEMYPAARGLVRAVRNAHAKALLFLTWAHRHGWPENGLRGYSPMQTAIDSGYLKIGRELHVPVAPAGVAWSAELRQPTHPDLWIPDGSHPTVSGTYLAACVFYATMFHQSPVGLRYRSAGLSADTAAQLQRVATSVVLGRPARWGLRQGGL